MIFGDRFFPSIERPGLLQPGFRTGEVCEMDVCVLPLCDC